MKARISFHEIPKGLIDSLLQVNTYVHGTGLDPKLLELINYRISQINGCAFCLDMHHKDAVHAGETQQRLHGLPAWRESPYYSDEERAALAFAEELTLKCDTSDEVYDDLTPYFSKADIAHLALAVSMINTWNRLNKTARTVPGNYKVNVSLQ